MKRFGQPMRILVLTDRYPEDPPQAATGWLVSHVRYLRTLADVDVVSFQRVLPRMKSMLLRRAAGGSARPRVFPLSDVRDEQGGRVFLRRAFTLPDTLSWGLTAHLISLQHGRFLRRLCRDLGPDMLLVHFTHPSARIALACGRRFCIPVCIAANDTPAYYAAEGKHRAVQWMRRHLERADMVIAQCASHAEAVAGLIDHRRITVIPLAIDERFTPATPATPASVAESVSSAASPPQPFHCLFAGRLDDRLKHLEAVLHGIVTARTLTGADIRLTVAGEGILRDSYERLAKRLDVASSVEFAGWISHDALPALYRRHHLFVVPSEIESFGLVYLEAAAVGLPIIARAGAGVIPELTECGAVTREIDESNGVEVGMAVVDCFRHYARLRVDAHRAASDVRHRFSWERHTRHYRTLLEEMRGKQIC